MRIPLVLLGLSVAAVCGAGECPEPPTLFVSGDCKPHYYCEAPLSSHDGKSLTCPEDLTMEGRESKTSPEWDELKEIICKDKMTISTRKIGETKIFDYTQFRCTVEPCTVDPVFAYCPVGDACVKATRERTYLKCPQNSALEVMKKSDKRWTEVTSKECKGSNVTSFAVEEYRCRTPRQCVNDRYDAKSDAKGCGLKEKCSMPNTTYVCSAGTLQASFTKDLLWHNISTLICESNQFKDADTKDLPMAIRCVENAVCDINIDELVLDSCDEDDICSAKAIKAKTSFHCSESETMEFCTETNGKWKLRGSIDCYNKVLVEPDLSLVDVTKTKIRCRAKRENSMELYFKGVTWNTNTEKCEMPVAVDNPTVYNCNIGKSKYTWKFQGKYAKNGDWIDIKSAEFRNGVFVMKDKNGKEDPYIPMKFRCFRELTCEVDLSLKYRKERDCPINDDCIQPEYEQPKNQSIVCSDNNNMALEYQSEAGKPWKEIETIGCIEEKMTPADKTYTNIRCRTLRKCLIDKYFDAKNCENQFVCEQPKPDGPSQCEPNFVMQFKALDTGPWLNIDKMECDNERFKPISYSNTAQRDEIPVGFRCSMDKKCDLNHFYKAADCDNKTEICATPIPKTPVVGSTYELACEDPIMALRMKSEENGPWEVPTSLECKDNKAFEVNKTASPKYPLRIQCVKLKTTTCVHPCENCGGVEFYRATAWNDPVKFFCKGSNQFMIIGQNSADARYKANFTCTGETGANEWRNTDPVTELCLRPDCLAGKAIQCTDIILCTQKTPLVSMCNMTESNCGRLTITNYKSLTCPNKMALRNLTTNQVTYGNAIECDLQDGTWKYTLTDGSTTIIDDSRANVVCEYPGCDMSKIFPKVGTLNCNPVFQDCKEHIISKNGIYRCPDGHTAYFRLTTEESGGRWRSDRRFYSGLFKCCQGVIGQIIVGDGMEEDDYSCFSDFEPVIDRLQIKCARTPTCNEATPVTSHCNGTEHCAEMDFSDVNNVPTCKKRGILNRAIHINDDPYEEIDTIYCDKESSTWTAEGIENFQLERGDNVVCKPLSGANKSTPLLLLPLLMLQLLQAQ